MAVSHHHAGPTGPRAWVYRSRRPAGPGITAGDPQPRSLGAAFRRRARRRGSHTGVEWCAVDGCRCRRARVPRRVRPRARVGSSDPRSSPELSRLPHDESELHHRRRAAARRGDHGRGAGRDERRWPARPCRTTERDGHAAGSVFRRAHDPERRAHRQRHAARLAAAGRRRRRPADDCLCECGQPAARSCRRTPARDRSASCGWRQPRAAGSAAAGREWTARRVVGCPGSRDRLLDDCGGADSDHHSHVAATSMALSANSLPPPWTGG